MVVSGEYWGKFTAFMQALDKALHALTGGSPPNDIFIENQKDAAIALPRLTTPGIPINRILLEMY